MDDVQATARERASDREESPALTERQRAILRLIVREYVATGRPLLLIGGEGATANLVARHGLGVSSPNHITRIKALLIDIVTGAQQLVPPDAARVNRFEYQSLTGELAAILDAAVRARPVR